jgi:hypothetical protein
MPLIVGQRDRIALEFVCEDNSGHRVFLASKITKQGVSKFRGYSHPDHRNPDPRRTQEPLRRPRVDRDLSCRLIVNGKRAIMRQV